MDETKKRIAPLDPQFLSPAKRESLVTLESQRGESVELTDAMRARILQQLRHSNLELQKRVGFDLKDYGYFEHVEEAKPLVSGKKLV